MNRQSRETKPLDRRGFLKLLGLSVSAAALTATEGLAALRSRRAQRVWQIDPFKCINCGRCATACVLKPSAVKCVHDFTICGYCRLCFGFFRTDPLSLDTGAENQMCPTGAITRTFIEVPYYEYRIDEDLCIGCGRCTRGCNRYGNGSLYLQVRHNICLNCNQCAIAAACPAQAFVRLPADRPYVIKHEGRLPR